MFSRNTFKNDVNIFHIYTSLYNSLFDGPNANTGTIPDITILKSNILINTNYRQKKRFNCAFLIKKLEMK